MGDTPGVRTRLQSKQVAQTYISPKKSSESSKTQSRRPRQSSQSISVNEKIINNNATQNEKSELATENSDARRSNRSLRESPKKLDLNKNISDTPRKKLGKPENKRKSDSSGEEFVPSTPNTRTRSMRMSLRSRLSISESKKKEISGNLKKSPSNKRANKQSPRKRKLSHTSESEVESFEISRPKRNASLTRITSISKNIVSKKDNSVQDDDLSVGSSKGKNVSNNTEENYSSESDDSRESFPKKQKVTRSKSDNKEKKISHKVSPAKRKLSSSSDSEVVTSASSQKKYAAAFKNTSKFEVHSGRKEDSPVKGDTNDSAGSSEEKRSNNEVVEVKSVNVSEGSLEEKELSSKVVDIISVSEDVRIACGGREEETSCKTSASATLRQQKSPSLVAEPAFRDKRNSLTVANLFQESSTFDANRSCGKEKDCVVALHRLSPDSTSVSSDSLLSAPLKETRLSRRHVCDSSDDTFEEIPEKVPEEIEISLDKKHEKLGVSRNLDSKDNTNSLSNQEVVLLDDDASNDENPVKVIEEKKSYSNDESVLQSSSDHKIGVQNSLSLKNNSGDGVTGEVNNYCSDKSLSTATSSKHETEKLLESCDSENASVKSSGQLDTKVIGSKQGIPQSPESSKKSTATASVVTCDQILATDCSKQREEVALSGSNDGSEEDTSLPIANNNKGSQKDKQGEPENKKQIINCDDSGIRDEVTRKSIGNKSVATENASVTNFITLDSDESSEFSVTELATLEIKQGGQETMDESPENEEVIEVRGVTNDSENESSEEESGLNVIDDDDIEVIEMEVKNTGAMTDKMLMNEISEEGPANKDDRRNPSSQGKNLSDLSFIKKNLPKNKLLTNKSVYSKISHKSYSENTSKTDIFAIFNEELSLHHQNEGSGSKQSSKSVQASPVNTMWNSELPMYKSSSINAAKQIPQKLLDKNISASKILEVNFNTSSSDVEEIVNVNIAPKKFEKKKLKEHGMQSVSVNVRSPVTGKRALVRTESEKVEENLGSDSDAESRKKICQKMKMRIAKSVAESTGSNSKQASCDDEDPASLPAKVIFPANRKSPLEPLARTSNSKQQQKRLLKMQRRKRLEMLKQLKEEKLNRLKESMASKEDASCSSSESSAEEREKRNPSSRVHDGFTVSTLGKVVKQDRLSDARQAFKKKKKKRPPIKILNSTKPKCMATTEWIVEDLSRNKSKLRRLPDMILAKLNNHQQRFPNGGKKIVQQDGGQKKTKRKHWKETGRSVDGFNVATDADFIPMKTGTTVQFGVVPLDRMVKAAPALAKTSATFRNSMLYSNRVQRQPAKTLMDRQLKLKAGGKDGLVRHFHF